MYMKGGVIELFGLGLKVKIRRERKMAVKVLFDFDFDSEKNIYQDAKDTLKYCEDIIKSIEGRVFDGENIEGFSIVPGKSTREVTTEGFKYLEKVLDKDKLYETKPIGITKLEKLLSKEDVDNLVKMNYIKYKEGKDKIVLE